MRELTKEELELAYSLDWKPTHYWVNKKGVMFESNKGFQLLKKNGELSAFAKDNDNKVFRLAKPIPRKHFDISEYEFNCGYVAISNMCVDKIELVTDNCGENVYTELSKQDAIAIAKALGVTGEDL